MTLKIRSSATVSLEVNGIRTPPINMSAAYQYTSSVCDDTQDAIWRRIRWYIARGWGYMERNDKVVEDGKIRLMFCKREAR